MDITHNQLMEFIESIENDNNLSKFFKKDFPRLAKNAAVVVVGDSTVDHNILLDDTDEPSSERFLLEGEQGYSVISPKGDHDTPGGAALTAQAIAKWAKVVYLFTAGNKNSPLGKKLYESLEKKIKVVYYSVSSNDEKYLIPLRVRLFRKSEPNEAANLNKEIESILRFDSEFPIYTSDNFSALSKLLDILEGQSAFLKSKKIPNFVIINDRGKGAIQKDIIEKIRLYKQEGGRVILRLRHRKNRIKFVNENYKELKTDLIFLHREACSSLTDYPLTIPLNETKDYSVLRDVGQRLLEKFENNIFFLIFLRGEGIVFIQRRNKGKSIIYIIRDLKADIGTRRTALRGAPDIFLSTLLAWLVANNWFADENEECLIKKMLLGILLALPSAENYSNIRLEDFFENYDANYPIDVRPLLDYVKKERFSTVRIQFDKQARTKEFIEELKKDLDKYIAAKVVNSLDVLNLSKETFGVSNYVSLREKHRDDILKTRELIMEYLNKEFLAVTGEAPMLKRPLNILLYAPPGSGKSFLVKCLKESIDEKVERFQLIESNASQWGDNIERHLIQLFELIRNIKANGNTPFVLLDEIDSNKELAKWLIMPMYDGKCLLQGSELTLGSFIWFVVISRERSQEKDKKVEFWTMQENEMWNQIKREMRDYYTSKSEDFWDRIDLSLFVPPWRCEFSEYDLPKSNRMIKVKKEDLKEREYREKVLITASLLRKYFPKLYTVEKAVLFLILLQASKFRSVRELERVFFQAPYNKSAFKMEQLKEGFRNKFRDLQDDDSWKLAEKTFGDTTVPIY